MPGNSMFFQSFIDDDLWNRARWSATGFETQEGEIPYMALLFNNPSAGRKIFESWHYRIGSTDSYEELRIAIVEGDIPGKGSGYSVHVSSEPYNTARRARDLGMTLDVDQSVVVGRINRMNPAPGSPYLGNFKRAYAAAGEYRIAPLFAGCEAPDYDFSIVKKDIHIRNIADVKQGDIDHVVTL